MSKSPLVVALELGKGNRPAPRSDDDAGGGSYRDRKVKAAEAALAAQKDGDAKAYADAVSALVRTCQLEESEPDDS